MEITLEKIELVRDRTGVDYKEAKDALEAADGSVVDAIIAIEESMGGKISKSTAAKKDELIDKMKEVVAKGNVSKIRVIRDGETILNIPLVAGILGTVIAPWGIIAGTVAAFGFKCKIEFVKDDGSVVDLSEKAGDAYNIAKEKGGEFVAEVKDRAPDTLDDLRTRGEEVLNRAKETAEKSAERFKKGASDVADNLADDIEDFESDLEEMQKEAAKGIKDFEAEVKDEK